jgi:hypothetical protein
MAQWDDPTAWWLNLTNLGLALLCLVLIVVVLGAAFHDVATSLARRIRRPPPAADPHAFEVPGLGLTMADGGHPMPTPRGTRKSGRGAEQ